MANLNLTEQINEVIYNVVSSYCDLQLIDSSLNIKTRELEDLQANLETARLKLEKGLIPEMDILQMELQGSSVLTEIESLKKDQKNQLARFYSVLGTQTMEIKIAADNSFLNQTKECKDIIDRLNQINPAELNIPQIKIRHIQTELAERRLNEAKVKNLPIFVPSFNVRNEQKTREESVMLAVKFPLYDKGIKKEEIKLASNELVKQGIERDNLVKNTRVEITTSLDEIKDKERRIGTMQKEIGLAEKIYEIARIRHSRGLIPAKDLLDYQRDVFNKQKTIFELQIGILLDYVKLLKITGELYHAYQKNIL